MTKPIDREMARLIHELWERNQGQVQNRLQLLDSAAAANRQGDMGEELRREARSLQA